MSNESKTTKEGLFLVGWGSFSADQHRRPDGEKTIIIVDDYTSIGLYDQLFEWSNGADKPNWNLLAILEPLANHSKIYLQGGVPCPRYDQLPVVYCLEYGNDTGKYLLRATKEEAISFITREVGNKDE